MTGKWPPSAASVCTLTVDLRNTDEDRLVAAEQDLASFVADLASSEGVSISDRTLARFEPVDFDPRVVETVGTVADRLGHTVQSLPSGAGHDAQMLARVCHNPAEHTDPVDLVAGCDVLLQTLLALDRADLNSEATS